MKSKRIISEKKISNKVAGGEYSETSGDSFLLHKLGLCTYYSAFDIEFEIGTAKEEEVQAAWKAVGISFIWHGDFKDNEYYLGTQKISRRDAAWHAVKVTGSKLNPDKEITFRYINYFVNIIRGIYKNGNT